MYRFLLLAGFALLIGCSGGGGHSPSEPSVSYPTIGGSWSGLWQPIVTPIGVRMTIVQGANGHFTGTFTSLGNVFDISGDASPGLGYSWHAINGGCGTLTSSGQFNALAASTMAGNIDLDTRGCPSSGHFVGDATLTRTSSVPAADSARGTVAELERALRAARPR